MASNSSVAAVIFDMDGVLTDSEPLICAAATAMFQEFGLVVRAEDFMPFIGTGENRYLGGVAEKYGFSLDIPRAKKRTYELYLEIAPAQLRAFPGARDFVLACRRAGYKTALASSADPVKIEANLGIIALPPADWHAITTGEEVEHKKPAPDLFLAAARKLDLAPGRCVVIEDAVNGIEAAKAAGMRCVAVAHTFPAEKLLQADLTRPLISQLTLDDLVGN
jgi:beta-phosphoglucomutase